MAARLAAAFSSPSRIRGPFERAVLPGGLAVEAFFDFSDAREIHRGVGFLAFLEDGDGAGDVPPRHLDGAAHRHVLRVGISLGAAASVDIALQQTLAGWHVRGKGQRYRDRHQSVKNASVPEYASFRL